MKNHHVLDDNSRFDRLVDGELSGGEYRELLASLDDEPGGWRRCAMAFLESQAWSRECRDLCRPIDTRMAVPATTPAPTAPWRNYLGLFLATAASFAIALALGMQIRQRLPGLPEPAPSLNDVVSVRKPASESTAPKAALVGRQSDPFGVAESLTGQPWGRATLVMDGNDGSAREIELPVFDVDNVYGRYQFENATVVPEDVVRELLQHGYEVRRDLRWAPFDLGEGRHMYVPYGQVEIMPVSGAAFR